jgi:hypothetical protein
VEGLGRKRLWLISIHYPGPPEAIEKKSKIQEMSVRASGVPAEIRVEYRININRRYHHLRNFLGVMCLELNIDG